jgi:hypothetical protein
MARIPMGIEKDLAKDYQQRLNNREKKLAEAVREDQNIDDDFQQGLVCSQSDDRDGTVYVGGGADQECAFHSGKAAYELHVEAEAGTPTAIFPFTAGTAGVGVTNDATNGLTDFEITNGINSLSRSAYTVGSFPGAKTIFFECDVDLTTVASVTGLWAGWRLAEAYTTPAAYDSYATVYKDGSDDIYTSVELDGAGANSDDTGLNWADGENYALRVEVDNDGSARMYVAGTEYLAAPTHTFTSGDVIIPFLALDCESTTAGFTFSTWKCGVK